MLLTTGAVVLPSTLRRELADTAVWVSTASVVVPVFLMVPPLRLMALAAMLTPSRSRSLPCTV